MSEHKWKAVQIAKAMPVGDQEIPDTTITIQAANFLPPDDTSIKQYNIFFEDEAEKIFDALRNSLPGGTFDRLLGKMLAHKASSFKVLL